MTYRSRPGLWYLLVAVAVWGAIMQVQVSAFDRSLVSLPPWNQDINPVLAAELASSTTYQQVVDQGEEAHNIKVLRVNTYLDFGFIALYWALFVAFASLTRPVSKSVIALISLAAIADLAEDRQILRCLSQLAQTKSVVAWGPGVFGYTKWLLFAAALIALAIYVWKVGEQLGRSLAIAAAVAGVLMAIGLVLPIAMIGGQLGLLAVLMIAGIAYFPFSMTAVLQFIEYVYLLRFQIVFGVLLAIGLPALYWIVPSIFVGLFDARGFVSLMFVAWATFQFAWTIMVTSRLVLVYGPERFTTAGTTNLHTVGVGIVTLFGVLATPFLAVTWLATTDLDSWSKLGALLLGLAAALVGLFISAWAHFYIEDDSGHSANKIFPAFGRLRQQGGGQRSAPWSLVDALLAKLPGYLQAGIVRNGRLRSGHEMATIAVAILGAVYVTLGLSYRPDIVRPEKLPAALFYLVFLLMVFTWVLSGIAFFLDRLRLPVFSTILLFSVLTGMGGTDHQFEVSRHPAMTPLPPDTVVDAWAEHYANQHKSAPKAAIIVATAGGGIRAAAWTAQVLAGLQEDCGPEFGNSLLLVSSVSGGSVGSMFALAAYDPTDRSFPAKYTSFERVRFDAGRSSLSSVGWGLLYPDLARTVPFLGPLFAPQIIDRGWALENAWISGWKNPPNMSDWRIDVSRGTRPAVIFNAITAEGGKRFVVASTDLAPKDDDAVRFFREYPNLDVPVATAARLSASFPYVSPEGRASQGPEKLRFHMGDGGYYDNSGVVSALEWIDAAKELSRYPVIFILIDAAPGTEKAAAPWSWQRQIIGPVGTLLSVRSSSQTARDKYELKQAQNQIGGREPIRFLYSTQGSTCEQTPRSPLLAFLKPDESDPLSWHLNARQKCYVEKSWNAPDVLKNRSSVCEALGRSKIQAQTIGLKDHE